jgi:hypothetical protein
VNTNNYGGRGKRWSLRDFFISRSTQKINTNIYGWTGKRWSLGVNTNNYGGIGKRWSLRDFFISRSAQKINTNILGEARVGTWRRGAVVAPSRKHKTGYTGTYTRESQKHILHSKTYFRPPCFCRVSWKDMVGLDGPQVTV